MVCSMVCMTQLYRNSACLVASKYRYRSMVSLRICTLFLSSGRHSTKSSLGMENASKVRRYSSKRSSIMDDTGNIIPFGTYSFVAVHDALGNGVFFRCHPQRGGSTQTQ